jgi:hypothetical protein
MGQFSKRWGKHQAQTEYSSTPNSARTQWATACTCMKHCDCSGLYLISFPLSFICLLCCITTEEYQETSACCVAWAYWQWRWTKRSSAILARAKLLTEERQRRYQTNIRVIYSKGKRRSKPFTLLQMCKPWQDKVVVEATPPFSLSLARCKRTFLFFWLVRTRARP